jgi:hypothetical protein
MAQLSFFLNKDEKSDLISYALQNGYKLVPDKHYDENAYLVIDTIEKYLEFSENNPMFFY